MTGRAAMATIEGTNGADVLVGTPDNDYITGYSDGPVLDTGPNDLSGLGGNDTLLGGDGDNRLDGGDGDDHLSGGYGEDLLLGGGGNDTLNSWTGNDTVHGGPGHDEFDLYAGGASVGGETARFWGEEGDDIFSAVTYGYRLDILTGGPGWDVYSLYWPWFGPTTTPDEVTDFTPGRGGDAIEYENTLHTSAQGYVPGTDPFAAGYLRLQQSGPDTLFQFDWDGPGGSKPWVTVLILKNTLASELTPHNFEPAHWTGTGANDRIEGTPGRDLIDARGGKDWVDAAAGDDNVRGRAGDDTLVGSGGNDVLAGDAGADRIAGEAGNDTLTGDKGDDYLNGGAGPDRLIGGLGDDSIQGGAGTDTLLYSDAAAGVAIDVGAGTATGGGGNDRWSGIEILVGSAFADTLAGSIGDDRLEGQDGDDRLSGGAGEDVLYGGEGSDRILGGAGDDVLGGSLANMLTEGDDLLSGDDGNDLLWSGWGADTLTGGEGADSLFGISGTDRLDGGAGNDSLEGGAGDDTLRGGLGDDTIKGESGSDLVLYDEAAAGVQIDLRAHAATGGTGTDHLSKVESVIGSRFGDVLSGEGARNLLDGGGGADRLTGDRGADELIGGAAADRFIYLHSADSGAGAGSRDVIRDFSQAQGDRMLLAAIDADATSAGNQAFAFIGDAAFTAAGQLRFVQDETNNRTLVEGNVNRDLAPDFQIELPGLLELSAGDFVL